MIELTPGVKRRLSRRNDPNVEQAEAEFERIKPAILTRDRMTCQGCGMRTVAQPNRPQGYFEVHHIDDDHHNNAKSNLTTLCPFCHMVFTLGRRGERVSGELIALPNLSQARLNLLCHVIFGLSHLHERDQLEHLPGPMVKAAGKAPDLYIALQASGRDALHDLFHDLSEMFEIDTLSTVLATLPQTHYRERQRLLGDVRILPVMSHFKVESAYWAEHLWAKSSRGWGDLLDQVSSLVHT